VSEHTSSLRVATENDIERAAAIWLDQIASSHLSSERRAEFEQWLADPRHEVALARLIIAELDAELFGNPSQRRGS
jgi:ferric-dicitrate binding protein FerR (iron transport regulator)